MSDNDIEIRGTSFTFNRTGSTNVSGINAYYNFDSFGSMTYSTTAKQLFWVCAVQSSHPAGGGYYTVSAYYLAQRNMYSGGWTEDWLESNATSGQGTTTSIGHHRSGTTYNASLAESYSASTYSMAWQLGMGGSGTANAGWNGWAYEITSYP